MAINFPSSPTVGDTFTDTGKTWTWNGTAWVGTTNSTFLEKSGGEITGEVSSGGYMGFGRFTHAYGVAGIAQVESTWYCSIFFTRELNYVDSSSYSELTVSASGMAMGRTTTLIVENQSAGGCAFTFPSGWTWMTPKPNSVTIAANGYLKLVCTGSTESDVFAAWHTTRNSVPAAITPTSSDTMSDYSHTHSITGFLPLAGGTVTGEVVFTKQVRTNVGSSLGSSGTLTLDMSGPMHAWTTTLSGSVTFATSNVDFGRSVTVLIAGGSLEYTLSFPAGWRWVGKKPVSIAPGKWGILSITSFVGDSDSWVTAAYAVEE